MRPLETRAGALRPRGRVVRFDPALFTAIETEDRRWFLFECHGGRRRMVDAQCRHRGGPLDKAERHRNGAALRCPWHGCITPARRLAREAVPAVFVPGQVAVVLPRSPARLRLRNRRILANEASEATGDPAGDPTAGPAGGGGDRRPG